MPPMLHESERVKRAEAASTRAGGAVERQEKGKRRERKHRKRNFLQFNLIVLKFDRNDAVLDHNPSMSRC